MEFYVGNYTRLGGPGVCRCEINGNALKNTAVGDEKVENPTYVILSRDKTTLFAASSTESDGEAGGSIATYDLTNGQIHLTSIHSTAGTSPCHLVLSEDERFLYVANYSSGSISVFPVEGGKVGKRVQLVGHEGKGPNEKRQEGAHVHFVAFHPDDERLYAVDLGMDAVMIYRADRATGLLAAEERVDVPAGLGPRHLVFKKDMMYVAHELGNAVSALRNTAAGWKLEQTLSTLPEDWEGESTVAAIRLAGDRLFVSNRGHNSIAQYAIREGGTLTCERIFSTFGDIPRDFIVLEDGRILVAHQDSGDIRILELDEHGVTQAGGALPSAGAVCLCPVE